MIEILDKLTAWWKHHQYLRRHPEAAIVVGFDDECLWCDWPHDPRQQIAWRDLRSVTIRTTDEGPFQPDVFWQLEAVDGSGVVYPNGATGSTDALDRLQELPGFDNEAILEAMGTTMDALG